jgi:TetR/AcrR family transcriptional regulator
MNNEQNMEQTILKAATRLFLEKGFSATTTTEIAKEAGCNQALVHYYYRTKDKLFAAIFEHKMKNFITNLLQISEEQIPFEEKLTRKIESHFDIIMEDPKFPLFFFAELSANPKRLEILKQMLGDKPQVIVKQFQEELQNEIDAGRIRPISVFDLLMTIVSLNIVGFILEPVFKMITNISDEDYQKLLGRRKREHVHIVLQSLKP